MSNHEANKMIRVLKGERLKYTVRVHMPDDSVVEWQTNKVPKLDFNLQAQSLFIQSSDYPDHPIMKWEDGMIMLCEENPDMNKP